MKLPQLVRATVRVVASRVGDLPGVKTAAERAPSAVINTALKGAEYGVAGYGVLRRTGEQVTGAVRAGVAAGKAIVTGSDEKTAGPAEDPWTGGPLQPVDDIREAVELSDEDAAAVEDLPTGDTLSHDALPLEDYDHLTLGTLRGRIRKLSVAELLQLREYEHAHANRLPVVKMFDTRLGTLAKQNAGAGAPS